MRKVKKAVASKAKGGAPRAPASRGKTAGAKQSIRKGTKRPAKVVSKKKRATAKRVEKQMVTARRPTPKSSSKPTPKSRKGQPAPRALTSGGDEFRVRALDPQQKCGAATSVQALYRVDELAGNVRTAHLVFLDRHGWYCVHGASCPAVGHARKFGDGERRNGPTHNGRMRA